MADYPPYKILSMLEPTDVAYSGSTVDEVTPLTGKLADAYKAAGRMSREANAAQILVVALEQIAGAAQIDSDQDASIARRALWEYHKAIAGE